jgi:hypothetical protein
MSVKYISESPEFLAIETGEAVTGESAAQTKTAEVNRRFFIRKQNQV